MKNSTLENNTDYKEQLPGRGSSVMGMPVNKKEKKLETSGINDQVKLLIQFVSKKYSTNINFFFMETPKKESGGNQITPAYGFNQSITPLILTPTITGDSNGGRSDNSAGGDYLLTQ